MSTLRDAASMLIDIHGQHDNQTLLHRKNHLALLDLYAGEELRPVIDIRIACYRRVSGDMPSGGSMLPG